MRAARAVPPSVPGDGGRSIRLFLVHGPRLRGEALAGWLGSCEGFQLVGASSLEALHLGALDGRRPDVAVVDAGADLDAARRTIERLREEAPDLRVLAVGLDGDPEVTVDLIEAGAAGWVERGASRHELAARLRSIHRGATRARSEVLTRLLERLETYRRARPPAPRPAGELTDREQEVLELVAEGLTNKEIAGRLHLAAATVKNHVHSLLRKLGAARRAEAVRLAYLGGLIDDYRPSRGEVLGTAGPP